MNRAPAAWAWPALCALACLAVYLATGVRDHGWDAIAYAARLADDPLLSERYLSTQRFHPHHLLYLTFGQGACALLRPFGVRDPFVVMQTANAVCGAAVVFLAGWMAGDSGRHRARGVMTALVLGLSNAVWLFSTEVEVMVPALALILLALWIASRARTTMTWVTSGVALAGAILLHQIAVLAAVALTAAAVLGATRPSARHLAAFIATWVGLTGAVYLTVGIGVAGERTPAGLIGWSLAAGERNLAQHGSLVALTTKGLRAAAESLVTLTPFKRMAEQAPLARAAAAAALLVLAGAATLALASAGRVLRATRLGDRTTSALMLALAATSGFIVWFQPWNVDYWVYALAFAIVLVGTHAPPLSRPARVLAVTLLAALAVVDLGWRALPMRDPANAGYQPLVGLARQRVPRGALLVLGPSHHARVALVALPYFAGVRAMAVPPDGSPELLAALLDSVALTLDTGGPAFATGESRGALGAASLREPIGVASAETLFALRSIGARDARPRGMP